MGLTPEVGNFTVTSEGNTQQVGIRLGKTLGLAKQADGSYTLIGDTYYSDGKFRQKYSGNLNLFQQDLTAAYAVEDAKQKIADLGLGFEFEENAEGLVGQDGMIRMVAVSYS